MDDADPNAGLTDLDSLDGDAPPRSHHYLFAHIALSGLLHADADAFFNLFESPRAPSLLADIWRSVGEGCTDPADPPLEPNDTLQAVPFSQEDHRAVLFCLPRPERSTEAHYTLAVQAPPQRRWWLFTRPSRPRYFTLERCTIQAGATRTVLCEWKVTQRGPSHQSYGEGPPPERDAFIDAVFDGLIRPDRHGPHR